MSEPRDIPAISFPAHETNGEGNPHVRHERTDVDARSVVRFVLALVVGIVVVLVALWGAFGAYLRDELARKKSDLPLAVQNRAEQSAAARLPADPRLEGLSTRGLEQPAGRVFPPDVGRIGPGTARMHAEQQDNKLKTYGWIETDRVAHIPIEEAIRRIADRLPARKPMGTNPAKGEPSSSSSGRTTPSPAGGGNLEETGENSVEAAVELLTVIQVGGPTGSPTPSPSASAIPAEVVNMAFDQRLERQVPLDASFRDEAGKDVRLADLARGRPVILVLAYYRCPQLCNLVLTGLSDGLRGVAYRPGDEYDVITVSFDPRETATLAAAKKANYVESYGRPGAADHWHFLTGDKVQIDRVADAVGFHYAFDPNHDRFNHPSGIVLLTSQGVVSRYLFGIRFPPRDLKLGLMEASQGQVGSLVDQFLLYCFHYDQSTGRYAFAVMNAVRAGGALTVLTLSVLLVRLRRHDRHMQAAREATT